MSDLMIPDIILDVMLILCGVGYTIGFYFIGLGLYCIYKCLQK